MRWMLPLLTLTLALTACGGDKPTREVPQGVLQKDSMAYYLSQIHIVDAAMRHREVRKQSLQSYAKRGFIAYFDTAQVSRDRFLTSLEYWSEDFTAMSEIYDLAMERLSTQLAKASTEERDRKKERSRQ